MPRRGLWATGKENAIRFIDIRHFSSSAILPLVDLSARLSNKMAISPYFLSESSNIFHKSDELVVHFFINRMALLVRSSHSEEGGAV